MAQLFFDAPARLLSAVSVDAEEYEFLGISLLAHLRALSHGNIFAQVYLEEDLRHRTLRSLGHLYNKPGLLDTFKYKMVGKAFEYAIADLFQRRKPPYHTKICEAIQIAVEKKKKPTAKAVKLGALEALSYVRVAYEASDAEALCDFESFRIIQQANLGIGGAMRNYPSLRHKVDSIFCDRHSDEPHRRFAVLASLKTNPKEFWPSNFRVDCPLDIGITVSTTTFRDVPVWDDKLNLVVLYLTMEVDPQLNAWKTATRLVDQALTVRDQKAFLTSIRDFFLGIFGKRPPFDRWVEFISKNLTTPLDEVIAQIQEAVPSKIRERTIVVPTLGSGHVEHAFDILPEGLRLGV